MRDCAFAPQHRLALKPLCLGQLRALRLVRVRFPAAKKTPPVSHHELLRAAAGRDGGTGRGALLAWGLTFLSRLRAL